MARNSISADLDFLASGTAEVYVDGVRYHPRTARKPPAWPTRPDEMLDGIASSITVTLPIRTKCGNAREHWAVKAKRVKAEYAVVDAALLAHTMKRDELAKGCVVKMVRIGRRVDDDNLRGYCKHIRDAIACWLLGGEPGKRDDDPRITWLYEQRTDGRAAGVVVTVEASLPDIG